MNTTTPSEAPTNTTIPGEVHHRAPEGDDALGNQLLEIARPHLKFLEEGSDFSTTDLLADAGLDSMASINFLLDIEDELGIEIPDELIEENSFETIRTVTALVATAQAA